MLDLLCGLKQRTTYLTILWRPRVSFTHACCFDRMNIEMAIQHQQQISQTARAASPRNYAIARNSTLFSLLVSFLSRPSRVAFLRDSGGAGAMEGSRSKREEEENGETRAEGSIHGFESLHRLLEAHLEPPLFQVRLLGFPFSASFNLRSS